MPKYYYIPTPVASGLVAFLSPLPEDGTHVEAETEGQGDVGGRMERGQKAGAVC